MIANLSVLHRQTTTEFCIRCEDDKYAVEEMILILVFLDREKRISAIMKRMVEELFSSQNRKSLRLRVKVGVLLDMSNSLVFSKIEPYPLVFGYNIQVIIL